MEHQIDEIKKEVMSESENNNTTENAEFITLEDDIEIVGEEITEKTDNKNAKGNAPKKNKIILAIVGILLITVIVAGGITINGKNKIKKYESVYAETANLMLDGAVMAEKSANLIHEVWYDAIFDNYYESDTKDYVKYGDDFNTSLGRLFADSDFKNKVSLIEFNKEQVEGNMSILADVPKGKENNYYEIKELYNAYIDMTNLVLDPSGNLTSYTQKFNDSDSEFSKCYDTVKLLIK